MQFKEMELYQEMWLSEQIPLKDMVVILKENPDLEEYFGLETNQRNGEKENACWVC